MNERIEAKDHLDIAILFEEIAAILDENETVGEAFFKGKFNDSQVLQRLASKLNNRGAR